MIKEITPILLQMKGATYHFRDEKKSSVHGFTFVGVERISIRRNESDRDYLAVDMYARTHNNE